MPLPLGHTAIGLAAYKTVDRDGEHVSPWKLAAWITVLANLPDIDIVLGLLAGGNGYLFHRGPTHSLLFALGAGLLASQAWRLSRRTCFAVVFSHVLADMVLTSAPVSLFWPLEVHWSGNSGGWGQIAHALIFESMKDFGIVLGALAYIGSMGLIRHWLPDLRVPVMVRRRMR